MPETQKFWIDKCTSLKPNSQEFQKVEQVIKKTGCLEKNTILTQCLGKFRKDWRQCQNETRQLNQCLKQQKK